jgi:release factor glutamine methyltransferase
LLAAVLGVPRSQLVLADAPDATARAAFETVLARRLRREPLQYIVGTAPFRHIELAVGPGVFIPRPETELLVDAVLPGLRALASPVVVDLCAGSGALALSLADELPAARVFAVEQAGSATAWLERNAAGTGVEVVIADVADPQLLGNLRGQVHAVVSNPPYVPRSAEVAAEVSFDPYSAVFAGADGLAVIPAVIARAADLLRPGGMLAVEHDDTHAHAVPDLLRADGRWDQISDRSDLAGSPRFAVANRR